MQDLWQQSKNFSRAIRQHFHQYPELSWQEHATAEKIRQALNALNIPWQAVADTGTIATLNANASGPHLAFRADIDALPIHEKSELACCSQHAGVMHACGHDGHTAALLGFAQWAKAQEHQLQGPVSLVFQPAEEGGHGAKKIVESGLLDSVDAIYGWHNWPSAPLGQLFCPDQLVMSGNGTFEIEVIGQGGHASQPELCKDPVLAASAIHLNLQQIATRLHAASSPIVVTVTSFEAPSSVTVIPDKAKLQGSIRVPNEEIKALVNQQIIQISEQTAQLYGVQVAVTIHPRYQATINHPNQAQQMRQAWQTLYGASSVNERSPAAMASEDFSYYLNHLPGAFALIGTGDSGQFSKPLHNAQYQFNDAILPKVIRLFSHLAGLNTT